MLFNIGTVGFSQLENTESRYQVINDVINNSTNKSSIETNDEKKFVENKKQYGKDIGVIVRGFQADNKLTVTGIVPYADSVKKMPISDISVEKVNLEFVKEKQVVEDEYHVTFVNQDTDMEMTFYLQNVVDYLKNKNKKNGYYDSVTVSALAYGGKVVLPLCDDDEFEEEYGLYSGYEEDEEFDEDEEETNADNIITEGNILEDMEEFFVQSEKLDTVYHVLGKIKSVKELTNTTTKEKIYKLVVNTYRMNLDVYINKKDLLGMPSAGMRFMGTCWLQGNVMFK
ncbi:MAG: DUF3881 family protein [Clostridia bacterium]|nr:DUF3881 family protein [Clostridia bacterium]